MQYTLTLLWVLDPQKELCIKPCGFLVENYVVVCLDVIKSFHESVEVQQVLFQDIIHSFVFSGTWCALMINILLSPWTS